MFTLSRPMWRWKPAVLVAAAGYVLAMAWLLQVSAAVASGVLMAHLLAVITVPLLLWLNRSEERRLLLPLLFVALLAKLAGTLVRYFVVVSVYREGDALQYDRVGAQLAVLLRQGDFSSVDVGRVVGTGFIEIVTGIIYAFSDSSMLVGFLVYSWLGFWGLYLFYCAFRLACPEGDQRRYVLLLFFLPSMLFWPSSIGKEAWMTLGLGALAYGAARMSAHRRYGLPWIVLGVAGTVMVRPHVTVMAVASLMLAYVLRGSLRASFGHPLAKGAGIVALAVLFAFTFAAVESFFGLDESGSVNQVLEKTNEQTGKGGSEFDAPGVASPGALPVAVFSVLFRPLPHEVGNPQAFLTSLEGLFLLVFFARNWRRLPNYVPRSRSPYLAFTAAYSLLFAVAFSNIANFGILARQRTQLLPFLLVALAVPAVRRSGPKRARSAASDGDLPAPHAQPSVGAGAGAGR